jgi:hypothetical protein
MLESTSDPPDSVSFEEAIRLFKEWGFLVEPGPQPGDVTLILEGPDYRTYSVHPASELAQMATVALRIRQRNGTRFCRLGEKLRPSQDRQMISTPVGAIAVLLN